MKLYESMVNGFLDKAEFLYNKSSYSARITQLEQAIAALKEKRTDVMENRSERNRWIENFGRFSDLEELDRKAVIQLVQVITVLGKDELQIQFNYQTNMKSPRPDYAGTGKDGGLKWRERAGNILWRRLPCLLPRLSARRCISVCLWRITINVEILSKRKSMVLRKIPIGKT